MTGAWRLTFSFFSPSLLCLTHSTSLFHFLSLALRFVRSIREAWGAFDRLIVVCFDVVVLCVAPEQWEIRD